MTREIQFQRGKSVYAQNCFVCHQAEGQGVPNQIPPLAKSDFLATMTKDDIIRGVVAGRTGTITVNGSAYNGTMISLAYLSDEQIANVLTYVRNSWGNESDAVSVLEVAKIRQESPPPAAKSSFE